MKISKLIKQLQSIQKENGDCEVVVPVKEWCWDFKERRDRLLDRDHLVLDCLLVNIRKEKKDEKGVRIEPSYKNVHSKEHIHENQ